VRTYRHARQFRGSSEIAFVNKIARDDRNGGLRCPWTHPIKLGERGGFVSSAPMACVERKMGAANAKQFDCRRQNSSMYNAQLHRGGLTANVSSRQLQRHAGMEVKASARVFMAGSGDAATVTRARHLIAPGISDVRRHQ
jgi:hypothetical protein